MFPEGFIQRIRSQKYIDADNLLEALEAPSPVSIRINRSKWDKKPLNSQPVSWCSSGFYLNRRPSYTLDPLFHSGCYYPQEASGMFIEQVFRQFVTGDKYLRVLDLCGAPGGKSTHLSSLIGSRGLLIANEVIKTRASVLAENITKWGISNTLVTQNDPTVFSDLPGFFDIILIDAPCSGEGMFRDSIAVTEWSLKNAYHCSERQKRILSHVWPTLKENGILIYSTCTFNPAENEENIKWLITKYQAETVNVPISDFNGITEIEYHDVNGYGFYPGRIKGEGLFISVLRKTGASGKTLGRIRKNLSTELKRADLEIVKEWTGFPEENIIRTGDQIFSIPGLKEDYQILSQRMKIISTGTKICIAKRNGYVPDHELALSEGIRKDAFPVAKLDYNEALNYLRRDKFMPAGIPKGWIIAAFGGINLGFCNNIGDRVNNYYPVNWRIRMSIPETGKRNILNWNDKDLA
jgi:16S rRNA C967 or C1407 C5-methylase (RsmB/RsmF family)/NOL1/NOP2/fmu family ribosome biogenesis protein